MVQTAHLRIVRETDGAWLVQLGDGDGAFTTARLAPTQVEALIAAIREDLKAPPVVIENRDDVARSRNELRAGRRLGELLAAPAVAVRLGGLLNQARLADARLALVIDAEQTEILSLPWELLAMGPEGPPLDESGGTVARLSASLAPARLLPQGGRLRVLLGCPTPGDADCAAVIAALLALMEKLGLDPPLWIDPLENGRLPPAVPGLVDVLHYVCHGDYLHDAFVLQTGERPHLPGVLVGQVADDLGRLPLVVLDVCGAGDPGLVPLTTLVGQMLQGSAQAVVAPARAAHVSASRAFSQGLYRALGRGASVVRAVIEGRSQVRTLAHPHPSARAANILLTVSRPSTLRAPPPLDRTWIPEGWARPDAELRALLSRARRLALEEQSGHVGIEHLVRSLRSGEGGTLSANMRLVRDKHLEQALRLISPMPIPGCTDARATPRVRALLRGVPEGAGLDDLWRALVRDPDHGLHAFVSKSLESLIDPFPEGEVTPPVCPLPSAARPLATGLQRIWGPLDGLVLKPAPGERLGRASVGLGPELAITAPELPEGDPRLSRRHVAWMGPGAVLGLVERPLRRVRFGMLYKDASEVDGRTVEIRAGDLLVLTDAVWLRGVVV